MITKDIIQKLFLQEKDIITTHELNEIGFKKHDLAKLVEMGVLIRVKIGQYSIALDKAKKVLNDETMDLDVCLACAKYVIRIEPTNTKALVFILIANITQDLNEVMRITDILFKSEHTQKEHTNYLLSLKLLSTLMDLPEEYKKIVAQLEPNDIFLTREQYEYYFEFNHVVSLIWRGLFQEANKQVCKSFHINGTNVLSIVNRLLLKENIEKYIRDFEGLCDMALEGNYDSVIEELSKPNINRYNDQKALLVLTKAMKNLKEKGIIPENKSSNQEDLFKCIIDGDFEKVGTLPNIPTNSVRYVKVKALWDEFNKMKEDEKTSETELKYSELKGTFADIIYLLQNRYYSQALEKFTMALGSTQDSFLHKIYLIGLILFRDIIKLPEDLEQLLNMTTLEDIYMNENDQIMHSKINSWISFVYDGVYKNLSYNPFKNRYMAHFNDLFAALLKESIQKEAELDKKIKDSYRALDYDTIIKFLEQKQSSAKIRPLEKLILNLAITIKEMKESKKIPLKKNVDGNHYTEYLQANDFVSAKNHIKSSDNQQEEYRVLCSMLDDAIALENSILLIENPPQNTITKAVQTKDYNLAMDTIDKMYNKDTKENVLTKYFVVFMMIAEEPDYLKLNVVLNDISEGNPLNKLEYFRDLLKSAISNHRFIEVELLARFIESSDQSIADRLKISDILKANNQDKELAGYKDMDVFSIVSSLIDLYHRRGYDLYFLANSYNPKPVNIEKAAADVLSSRSVGVVGPISEKDFKRLESFVKFKYNNIAIFRIEAANNRVFIGLKYQRTQGPFISIPDYNRAAKDAMLAKDYSNAKNLYLELLGFFYEPRTYIYKSLAEISEIEGDLDKAIEYLHFAEHSCRAENNYREAQRIVGIINRIKYQIYRENKNKEEKRREELQTNKEYEAFADILYANWSKETLRELTNKMCLDAEEVKIIKLIVAKRCLSDGKVREAKNIINGVKRSKNNSPKVLSLLREVEGTDLNNMINALNTKGFIITPKKAPKK